MIKFSQDTLSDLTFQGPGGAWMDYRDLWNLSRLAGEVAGDVLEAHRRRQTHILENQRESVETGS
jgi:hypothetical protein